MIGPSVSRYRVLESGEDGMGVVWKPEDKILQVLRSDRLSIPIISDHFSEVVVAIQNEDGKFQALFRSPGDS